MKLNRITPWITLALLATGTSAPAADRQADAPPARQTKVSIVGEDFHLNGQPTYARRAWKGHRIEGLLLNSRMVQATFDDLNPETARRWAYADTGRWDAERNVREFIAAMPEWRRHGLLAVTVNFQGGSPEGYSSNQPWETGAFTAEGALRPEFSERMRRVLDAADEQGMVVILGYFYFGQDQRLRNEAAVIRAADEATRWLLEGGWRNVLVEVNNETDVKAYDHDVLKPARVHELIERVRNLERDGRRLLVGTSYGGGSVPRENVVRASDFLLLHGNGVQDPRRISEMVKQARAVPGYRPMPIVFNEDDHENFDQPTNNFTAALAEHASWGWFDFRRKGEGMDEGYQSPPVNWGLSSERKRAFFRLCAEITGVARPVRKAADPPPAWVVHDLTPLHDASRVLINPHKGWYHHYPDNHINKYAIAREADLLDFPGLDHVYIRLAWAYLEPKEGQFDWAVIDRIIEKWTAHGLGIAFRISGKETSTDRIEQQFATPRWVMEAGAQGGYYRMGQATGPEGPWEPAFDDPVYLAKLDRFLAAFAARYDRAPWVRYVDIGSIGDWGEGHSWAGSRKECGLATRKQHLDLHLKHFKQAPLVVSDDFVYALSNPTERAALHQYVLTNGISYRDDSILVNGYVPGVSDTFTVRSPQFFADAYPRTPTVLELEHYGSVKKSGNWEGRPESALAKFGKGQTGPDFFRGALGLLHATYIGYHGYAHEWLADNPDFTREMLNRCGYWLFPTSIELPESLVPGATRPLTLRMENRGVAPPYAPYELRVKLSGAGTNWVRVLATGCQSWLPGTPVESRYELVLPANLKTGSYELALGLFDVSQGKARAVDFALKASLRDPEGYYQLTKVPVTAAQASP